MKRRAFAIALFLLGSGIAGGLSVEFARAQQPFSANAAVRFATVDVYLESSEPLAAWQFELTETTGAMTVVGIENGESPAYAGTPHYDLEAVEQDRADRIVVADYSLADRSELPSGRTRVATVHVRLTGAQTPEFQLDLIAAGDADGRSIEAAANIEIEDGRAP